MGTTATRRTFHYGRTYAQPAASVQLGMATAPTFPPAEDDDSDDVTWALQTGRSMWAQGDHKEALRWVFRAAETASSEEDDLRSLRLAKMGAELRTYVEELHGPMSTMYPTPAGSAAAGADAAPGAAPAAGAAPAPIATDLDEATW